MAEKRSEAVKIFLSAGEASGDLHGASLLRQLRRLDPHVSAACLGGDRLAAEGARLVGHYRDLSLIGVMEVFGRAKAIAHTWRRVAGHLRDERPDLVVLIDFPDFNFILGRLAHRLGIKVFHYISPQVWAWRPGRVRTLKKFVDRMAVILPFEEAFYRRHGLEVTYVGHPLMDHIHSAPSKAQAFERYRRVPGGSGRGGSRTGPVVGLLPGSRPGEVRRLFPVLLHTAEILARRFSGVRFLVPAADIELVPVLEATAGEHRLPLRVVAEDPYGVIRACDLVVTASGTVTLETALLGTPMVIIYKVSPFEYALGRHLVRVEHIGLPNLIAGERVCPELVQGDASPERIAAEAASLLEDDAHRKAQMERLKDVARKLGTPGVAERVARMVWDACR